MILKWNTGTLQRNIGADKFNDSKFAEPEIVKVRETKKVLEHRVGESGTSSHFLTIFLTPIKVNEGDRLEGKSVVKASRVVDVFGNYVYTKVWCEE